MPNLKHRAPLKSDGVDERWMRYALGLARRGEGLTRPNPPVGAVIVRNGKRLGEGWHRRSGGPHAEVLALKGLRSSETRHAVLYVTLEPCSTWGRTPPCTEAIIQAGIARVVVCVKDPNPAHAGRGLRILRTSGIEVDLGVCREEGLDLIRPFGKWVKTQEPFVTLKMAMTLDGRIADASNRSQWITSTVARREVLRLRRRVDAILVGTRTALLDDPGLRASSSSRRAPLRLVLDARGTLPLGSKVFSDEWRDCTVLVTTSQCPDTYRRAVMDAGVDVWTCGKGRRVSLPALMSKAGREGILHMLCEGGGALAEQLVRLNHVDAFWFFVAPHFLGGAAVPVLGGKGWPLSSMPSLRFTSVEHCGKDVLIKAVPKE